MAIDSYQAGVLWVLLTVVLSIGGLIVVRKRISLQTLRECHDVGGALLSVIGTLYAVLLGLVVIDAMSRFQAAQTICQQEANCLADVYLLAGRMPKDKADKLRGLCVHYVDGVVNEEWRLMDDGKISMDCRKTALAIMRELGHWEPQTNAENDAYQVSLTEALQLWDNRRARTNAAENGVPAEEWMVLIIGGIVTTIFTYFFGLENLKVQIGMTSMVATLICLNLLLVLWFGYPFSGDRKVHPTAFVVDKQIFGTELTHSGGATLDF